MASEWTLIGSHGCTLFYLAQNPDATIREAAAALDLTERRIAQIIRDLAQSDMLAVSRVGRRNSYAVNQDAPFSEPFSQICLRQVIELVEEQPAAV